MTSTKYLPAYLLNDQSYDDPESCLGARGVAQQQAQELIARAESTQSQIVLGTIEADAEQFVLLVAEDDGRWRTWAGRGDAVQDTREQAEKLVKTFGQDVEWRIFGMRG